MLRLAHVRAKRISDVDAFKAAAKNFAGEEKTGVHVIAVKADNAVVDVEVAISEGGVARRIDIAGLGTARHPRVRPQGIGDRPRLRRGQSHAVSPAAGVLHRRRRHDVDDWDRP